MHAESPPGEYRATILRRAGRKSPLQNTKAGQYGVQKWGDFRLPGHLSELGVAVIAHPSLAACIQKMGAAYPSPGKPGVFMEVPLVTALKCWSWFAGVFSRPYQDLIFEKKMLKCYLSREVPYVPY